MSKSRTRCQLSVKTCATNFKQMTGQSEESSGQCNETLKPRHFLTPKSHCDSSAAVTQGLFLFPPLVAVYTHTHFFFFLTVLRMPTHWKRPRCWERLKAGEEAERGLDGRMVFPTQWRESEGQGGLVCCSPWSHKSWTRLGD